MAHEIDALTTLHAALYDLDRPTRSLNALADGGTHLVALFLTSANALPDRNAAVRMALARSAIAEISQRFINNRDDDVRVSVLTHLLQLAGCQKELASPRLIREWRAGLAADTLLASPSVAVLSHAWRAWGVEEGSRSRDVWQTPN